MSFNRDTYADDVLRLCGAHNVCAAETDRYCRIALGTVATRHPDVVLLPDEPYPFEEKHIAELRDLVVSGGLACRVRFVDGRALSWYGARTPAALTTIRAAISEDHP